jgi:hypothetical protein
MSVLDNLFAQAAFDAAFWAEITVQAAIEGGSWIAGLPAEQGTVTGTGTLLYCPAYRQVVEFSEIFWPARFTGPISGADVDAIWTWSLEIVAPGSVRTDYAAQLTLTRPSLASARSLRFPILSPQHTPTGDIAFSGANIGAGSVNVTLERLKSAKETRPAPKPM